MPQGLRLGRICRRRRRLRDVRTDSDLQLIPTGLPPTLPRRTVVSRIYYFTGQIVHAVDHMDATQWTVVVACVIIVGFLCMRGVGGVS